MSKSYNIMAGSGMDDMDYVNEFNLDPAVAYSDKINDAMLDLTYERNVRAEQQVMEDQGVESSEAFKKATTIADKLLREGKKSLKKLKKQRGY